MVSLVALQRGRGGRTAATAGALALGLALLGACSDAGLIDGGPGSGAAGSGGTAGSGGSSSAGSAGSAGSGGSGAAGGQGGAHPWAADCPWVSEHDYDHPSDAFFEPDEIVRIDVEMAPSDWAYQLDNPDLEEYRAAAVTVCGQRLEGVGMRFKKSSHPGADLEDGYPKNPMVLDLNELAPGQRMLDLRKINLEYGSDLMLVAERMNWELLAGFGLDVSRVNHARLYMNDEYIGVFTNVERVDRSFAKIHWGSNDGQLYKHSYCGKFVYQGEDPGAYTTDPRCYAPKPSDSQTDFSDLIGVIAVLNETSDGEFPSAFSQVWEMDAWLGTMAALQVLGYGDTPNANGNNFYTFYPEAGGPTKLALWDLDMGFWQDDAPCEHPADTVGWDLFRIANCFSYLPLFHRVLEVDDWEQTYLDSARDFLLGPFDADAYAARADELVALLGAPLSSDPHRRGDDDEWATDIQHLKNRQAARVAHVREQLIALGYSLP